MAGLLQWLSGAASRVGNTVNNDIVHPVQRDVVQPVAHAVNQNVVQPIDQNVVQPVQHFAAPAVNMGVDLGKGLYHLADLPIETARTGVAEITGNQAAQNAAMHRAQPGLSFLRTMAQGVPRAAYQLGESVNPAGGDVYNRTHTPTNPVEKFLMGSTPIPSMQTQYKQTSQTGGKARAAGEATLTAVMDALGAKQGAQAVADHAPAAANAVKGATEQLKPSAVANNHPVVQALNDHINQLNKQADTLRASGLSESSAALKSNAKAYAGAVAQRNQTLQSISQGGYVGKGPTPEVPKGSSAPDLSKGDAQQIINGMTQAAKTRALQPDEQALLDHAQAQLAKYNTKPGGAVPPETVPPETAPTEPTGPKPQTRGTVDTIKNSEQVSKETKQLVNDNTSKLTPSSHADLRANAEAAISKDLNSATEKTFKDLNQTAGRMTDQQQMNAIKVAQQHDALGNHETASQIYSRLAEHRSRTAQALAVGQELSRRTPEGIRYAAQKTLEDAGVKFEGDVANKVNALMDTVRKTQPGTDARNAATQTLIHEVNNMLPRSRIQAGMDLWRAGLLTGPETVMKVATSHAIVTPMEMIARPVAAGVDRATAALPNKLLNFLTRNKTGAPAAGGRTVTFSPTDYLKPAAQGLAEGTKSAVSHLKTGVDDMNTGGFEKALGGGHHQTPYEDFIYRVHGSVYKGPFRMGYKIEEANQLRLAKSMFGDNPKAIDEFMNKPSTQKAMTDYAENFAMQNKTAPGEFAQKLQSFKPGGVPVGQWLVPFSRIPAAIGVKGIVDYTPLGVIRAAKTMVDGISKGTFDQRAFAESLGRSAGGGTALVTAGGLLMKDGRMTLQEPQDPKEKQLWLAEGKQRNSIHVGGKVWKDSNGVTQYKGGKWISLNAMGPVGIALGIGGAFERASSGGAHGENAVAQAVGAGGKLLLDQPYMKGITGAGNALQDPVRYAAIYVRNAVTSTVPAGVQQVARGTDTQSRAYPDNMKDSVKQAIPVLREGTPTSNDMFGQTGKGQGAESGRVGGVLNPFFPSTPKNQGDPATGELQRLYDALGSKSVSIQPTTNYSLKGPDGKPQTVKLTAQQAQQMVKETGPQIHDAINKAIQNPSYKSADDNGKVSILNGIFNAYQNEYVKANFNPAKDISKTDARLTSGDLSTMQLGKGTGKVSSSLPGDTQAYLTKVNNMTTDERSKYFNSTPAAEYQYNLAKWQNDKANGTLTTAQDIRTQQSLIKDKVGSTYDKNVRDLYGLSKNELSSYINGLDPNTAQKVANQLDSYDQALYAAGAISKPKFSSGSSGSSGTSVSSKKAETVRNHEFSASGITTDPFGKGTLAASKSLRGILTKSFNGPKVASSNRFKSRTTNHAVAANVGITKVRKGVRLA